MCNELKQKTFPECALNSAQGAVLSDMPNNINLLI
jgi:hypothetical protein